MAWATTSLRRQTAVTLRGTIVLLVVLAGLCSTAVVWSAYALGSLNETAVPLQVANKEVLQDITDAETSIRGYALSGGDSGSLQPYLVAMSYLPQDEQRLRELAQADPELAAVVQQQEDATDRWLEGYVEPQLSPMNAGEKNRLYVDGQAALRRRPLGQRRRRHGHRAHDPGHQRPGPGGALLDAGRRRAAAAADDRRRHRRDPPPRRGRRTGRWTRSPHVLARLREGDLTARVREEGPEEIREIAVALNRLTEESLRSRDIEDTVVTQLGEIDRVRTELISTVSHELRTPLTSVLGYLELLEDQIAEQLDETQTAMLAVVRRNLDAPAGAHQQPPHPLAGGGGGARRWRRSTCAGWPRRSSVTCG